MKWPLSTFSMSATEQGIFKVFVMLVSGAPINLKVMEATCNYHRRGHISACQAVPL